VSIIDVFTRYTWVFTIQAKSDVMQTFLQFQVMVERLLNHKSLVFNLTGVVSIVIFINTFNPMVLLIVFLALTHINNKDVLNVNTDILLTPRWHCSLTVIFPKNFRMKLVLHHAT
jgi:hypothetical protein